MEKRSNRIPCVCVCVFGGWGVGCQLTGNRSDKWTHISAEREGKGREGKGREGDGWGFKTVGFPAGHMLSEEPRS